MKRFLVLYQSDTALSGPSVSEMFGNAPAELMKAGMAMWQAWMERCGSAMLDAGAPLDHSTTVTKDTSAAGRTTITGFSTLQADSIEEAVSLLRGHPHFHAPGASVQVLECVAMPGM